MTFGTEYTRPLVATNAQDRLRGLVGQVLAGFGEGGVTFQCNLSVIFPLLAVLVKILKCSKTTSVSIIKHKKHTS